MYLRPPPSRAGIALAMIPVTFLGVALVAQAAQPLWWDELYTTVTFVHPGVFASITGEYHANNHRLYTLLAQASVAVLEESEASLRLPSLIATAGSAIGLAFLLLRYVGTWTGILGLSLFSFSPLVLHWGPQARGYGLSLLASVALIAAALALLTDQPRIRRWMWLLALGGAVGTATLPHFVLPFWITVIGIGLVRRSLAAATALRAAVGTGVAVAIYLPGLSSAVTRYAGGTRGVQVDLSDSVLGPFRFLIAGQMPGPATLSTLLHPAVMISMVVIVGLAVAASVFAWLKRGDHSIAVVALAPLFGTFFAIAIQGLAMTDRTLMFLLPQLSVAVAYGFQSLERLPLTLRTTHLAAGTAGVLLISLTASGALLSSWIRSPIEDFRTAVQVATDEPGFTPVSDSRYTTGISYYDEDNAVTLLASEGLDRLLCTDHSRSYAYIHHRIGRQSRPPADCLLRRDGVRIEIAQRTRGPLEVWFVP